jgi:hypothetical protein
VCERLKYPQITQITQINAFDLADRPPPASSWTPSTIKKESA